jgi:hypothetical protein
MPRDGSQIYHRPPGTDGIPDTTIESTKYNINVADVEQDLNLPRPIIAGGTGANNSKDARVNLDAEVAMQLVTNYDSQVWEAGSFYSLPGATGAPVSGHTYFGTAFTLNPMSGSMVLEAFALDDGGIDGMPKRYLRIFNGTTWAAWMSTDAAYDARYVNVAGDTMSGDLAISKQFPVLILNNTHPAADAPTAIHGQFNGVERNQIAVSGWNQTSDLAFLRFNDDGSFAGISMLIERKTGKVNVSGDLTCQGLSASTNVSATGTVFAGGLNITGHAATTGGLSVSGGVGHGGAPADSASLIISGSYGGGLTFQDNAYRASIWTSNADLLFGSGDASAAARLLLNGSGGSHAFFGSLTLVSGDLHLSRNNNTGYIIYGNQDSAYFGYNGSSFIASGGPISAPGFSDGYVHAAYAGFAPGNVDAASFICSGSFGGGLTMQDGSNRASIWAQSGDMVFATGANPPTVRLILTAAANGSTVNGELHVNGFLGGSGDFQIGAQGYKPGGGSWADSSDARIKNELGDYTRGLEEIIALRPIYYTFKGNDTPVEPSHEKTGDPEKDAKLAEIPLTVPYPNSTHGVVSKAGTKYTGLIAQEVEAVIPEMVTKRSAFIDGVAVDDLRDLNTTPLVFALINAVKTLATRVEELEARQPAR